MIVSEYGIIPKKGKGYNFSFQDSPQLADLFNVVGIEGNITLTFVEDLVILEIITTSVTRVHSGGLYSYIDGISVTDNFLVDKSRGYNQSLIDVLSLNEIVNVTKTVGTSISLAEELSITDLFVYQLVSAGNLNFLEGLIAAEVFNAFRTSGYNLAFLDGVPVADQFVQTMIRDRTTSYQDRVDLSELFSAQTGRGWTFSFQDALNAADLYTMTGLGTGFTLSYNEMLVLAEQFNHQVSTGTKLSYNDIVTISEVYGSYIQRYAGSACNIYVDRVEADGGEVIDVTATCQAFTYFTTSSTSGYQYSYSESMSLSDVFNLVGVAKQRNASFIDTVSVADTAIQTPAYKNKIFLEDNLNLSDLFNIYRQANISLSLFDSVTLIDSQDRQVTFTGKYNLSMMDSVLAVEQFSSSETQSISTGFVDTVGPDELFSINQSAARAQFFMDSVGVSENFSSTGSDKTKLSFLDFVATLDQLGLARTATRNLIFNDSIALADQEAEYVQRYSGSACEIYVDRVEADGGEVIDVLGVCQAFTELNPTANTGYKLYFTESLSIMTFEAIVSGGKKNYSFAFVDSAGPAEHFVQTRSRNIFLYFTEQLDLAASN